MMKSKEKEVVTTQPKKRSIGGLILDIVLTICTGGWWLVVIAIRCIRKIIA